MTRKSRWLAIGLFVPVLLACIAGAFAWWHHAHVFYPTPETQSAFLRTYTPEHVIDRFREMSRSSSHTVHNAALAGHTSVAHQAGFEFYFVLRQAKWMPLMNALRDDALQQLSNSGAEVLSQSGDPCDGFHIDYKSSKSFGSLTISPLLIRRDMSLPEGTGDATVRIEQAEKWFPNGAGTIRLTVTSFVH